MIKVIFLNDYSPRKKGESVELESKLAEHYISLGVAKKCDCAQGTKAPCSDCEKKTETPPVPEPPKDKVIKKDDEVIKPVKKK